MKQHEDFPQDGLPQKDVDPGVQDLVPCGHPYRCQQTETGRFIFSSGAENDHMDLEYKIMQSEILELKKIP